LAQWTVVFVLFTAFTKFFILDEFGSLPNPYGSILLSIWMIGWLAVLLLGFLERYLYRLIIEFHPNGEARIVERGFFKRSRTFDSAVQFSVITAAGRSQFIRSSDEWEFGSLLSNEQRLGIVEKLNPRSSQSA
jgi:hypothetical protein